MNRRLLLMPVFLSIILAGGSAVRAESGARHDMGAPVLSEYPGIDDQPGRENKNVTTM